MTPRYRCPWCGSFAENVAMVMRKHIVKRHRDALEALLHPLGTFGTREVPGRPPTPLKTHPATNMGATGEGDS